jgi:endonuclease YncB( thermonuclease family)
VSKPLKLRKETVELRPSRIRRDPIRATDTVVKKPPRLSREQEIWLAITGIVLFAMAIAVVTLGFSALTDRGDAPDAVAAAAQRFGDCEDSANCVIDGETIRVGGATMKIAGMSAPRIRSPRCADEEQAGVEAVGRLRDLLNSGQVTTAGEVREPDGEVRTIVRVDGRDVGPAMVGAGVAREPASVQGSWC